jgi:GGDEF domain-containing protein
MAHACSGISEAGFTFVAFELTLQGSNPCFALLSFDAGGAFPGAPVLCLSKFYSSKHAFQACPKDLTDTPFCRGASAVNKPRGYEHMHDRRRSHLAFLSLPPLVSIPIILVLYGVRGPGEPNFFLAPIWAVVLLGYAILSGSYAVHLKRDVREFLVPLQLLTQGIVITSVSLLWNTIPLLTWFGVALLTIGTIAEEHTITVASYSLPKRKQSQEAERNRIQELRNFLGEFPLPGVITNADGETIALNEALKTLLASTPENGTSPSASIRQTLQRLTSDQNTLPLGAKPWQIETVIRKDHVLTYLTPAPPPVERQNTSVVASTSIEDPETGLFNTTYAFKRLEQELDRAFRYRRWISGLLFELQLESPFAPMEPSELNEGFLAFSRALKDQVRTSDLAFRLPGNRILLLLPETPRTGLKTLIGRLKILTQSLFEKKDETKPFKKLYKATLKIGQYFHTGTERLEVEHFLKELETSLASLDS